MIMQACQVMQLPSFAYTVLYYITAILLMLYCHWFLFVNLTSYALASLENASAVKCQKSITDKRPQILHKDLLH